MSDCIEYEGRRDRHGYGRHGDAFVHRMVMAEIHGWDAIEGKVVMHDCDNPPCVNADHLRIGTQADNLADMTAKGRRSMHVAKVTPHAVLWIRSLYQTGLHTQQELGVMFGISRGGVGHIVRREVWS